MWTKQDYELLALLLLIAAMLLLIPTVFFYDWLSSPVNWQKVLNFINWLLNEILKRLPNAA